MANQNHEYRIDHPSGFTEFCQAVGPEAFRLAMYWTRNRSEVEDVVRKLFCEPGSQAKMSGQTLEDGFFAFCGMCSLIKDEQAIEKFCKTRNGKRRMSLCRIKK